MLPFHKRSRANSAIEIGTEELEAVELPRIRPPSTRSSSYVREVLDDEDELTVVRMDKRLSSSPPPRANLRMPSIPAPPRRPQFDDAILRRPAAGHSVEDEEPTMLAPSSRPVLSMSSRKLEVAEPSRARIEEPPRSSRAVDPNTSAMLRDLSMTSSVSTDVSKMRRGPGWAMVFMAIGILGGLVVALALRGDGIAAAAALVDPTRAALADVVKPVTHAQAVTPGAAPMSQVDKTPAAGACNADAVAAAVVAKVEARDHDSKANHVDVPPVEKVEHKAVVTHTMEPVTYVAPKSVARHVDAVAYPTAQTVAAVDPPAKVATPAAKKGKQTDLDSASAADALAKAQLDAALTR